ncbi:MAG TPA: serine/threonine-protein kinase [Kofleriaceae bacterium]|nr:serine/threonine-protein kinase [Kofleriaceae bacterium]
MREPTQSLNLSPEEQAAAVLALGTHNRPVTAIESPGARGKTPLPPPRRRADEPADYLGTVLGSYRVSELLGKGGMGYVYRAEHIKLGREVALKLLRNDYASRRDAVSRFFQEARTVNRVRHRNIVDVTDFVELDDGTTYIVMELLTGTSLGAWAQSGVDLARAIAVLVQICDGLGAAHQVGVVHRDLKPDNVVVVPMPDGGELVKLLDFGVAKLLNRDDEDVGFQTAAGSVIGTPAYMSPEQAGGMVIDARSDIYSLGAIMYELFTGQPMFRGRSFGEYVRKHLTEMPVPPHDTPGGAGIDPRLEALILKSLDKDPDQRFARIAELREELLHLLSEADAASLYPPPASSLSGSAPRLLSNSAPRLLRTPLPPVAAGLPLPAPTSQSFPGLDAASPAPAADAGAAGVDPRGATAPSPQISEPPPAAHPSGPQPLPPPSSYPSAPHAATPHPATPHPATPHAASPHAAVPAGPPGAYPPPLTLDGAYSLPPPLTLDGSYRLPAPPPTPSSPPWWLWFSTGALAVGLGIAGALWYAGRNDPDLAPRPVVTSRPGGAAPAAATSPAAATIAAPAATPAATPPAAPHPALLEVRFDSTPSGSVYADGQSTELCRTPCSFDIDPADGGPADQRVFVVKRDGYVDRSVTVDLATGPREFQVALTRAEPAPAHVDASDGADHHPARRPTRPAHRPDPRPASSSTDGPAKKPGAPIDPTDTLDPFRKK